MDLTVLAYATLGLSLFVSAVKMGSWILHADPRTLVNGGRWALVALAALAVGVLLWLVMSGRWSMAMMLAAFMLPVFVQAAPRWRVLFGPLNAVRGDFPPITPDFSTPRSGFANARDVTDPELVQQSLAVLRAYLAQSGPQGATQIEHKPASLHTGNGAMAASGTERQRPGDQGHIPPARGESRSRARRHPLPDGQDHRGQRCSAARIDLVRPCALDLNWGGLEASNSRPARAQQFAAITSFDIVRKVCNFSRSCSRSEMAHRRHDLWLLIRLAAQNVGRRRLRAVFLSAAVMLGVGIAFASFVAGWALREGMATSFSRMGADLVVVPRGTLVNITSSLLTVQPTDETLPDDLAERIAAIPGVAKVAPQRIVPALVAGNAANLIAFDPARDLSVLTWLVERQGGAVEGLIAGGGLAARLGESVSVCGMPMRIYGRLGKTGVGPFDDSYFLSFGALADMVSFCRTSDARAAARPAAKPQDEPQIPGMSHTDANVCSPDVALDRVSALLLQLSPGAKLDEVKFALARLPDVKIVEGNGVITSSRQALSTLLIGIAAFTAFQLIALLILVSLLFSAIVQERYREVGLLRAMGAKPNQVMTIILTEAAIITGLGGLAGLAFGAAMLLMFARSIGFYFGLLGVPFAWPPLAVLQISAVLAVSFSAVLGLVGAFLPAWRARRMAPYALIQAEGR
jgi:putative ABC transport system permease protein